MSTWAAFVRIGVECGDGTCEQHGYGQLTNGLAIAIALAGGASPERNPQKNASAGIDLALARIAQHCSHEPTHDDGRDCLSALIKAWPWPA